MTDTTDLLAPTGESGSDQPTAPRSRRRAIGSGLAAMVLPELQNMAAALGIASTGRMRKSQLIEAIQARQADETPADAATTPAPRRAARRASAPAGDGAAQAEPSATPTATGLSTANGSRRSAAGQQSVSSPEADDTATDDTATRDMATDDTATDDTAARDNPVPPSTSTPDSSRDDGDAATSPTGGATSEPSSTATEQVGAEGDGTPDGGVSGEAADAGADERPERPERVDRGRERFLEREARRAERHANGDGAAGHGERGSGDAVTGERDPGDRSRGTGSALERVSAAVDLRRDGRGEVDGRPQPRTDGDGRSPGRYDSDPRPDGEADRFDRGPRTDRDEDGASRRGRFRERGRGRNRPRGTERFGADSDPVISEDDVLIPVAGILDILDSYGFVRTTGYLTGPSDVYVTLQQIKRYGLRRGDAITGAVRQQREAATKDKYNALVRLDAVNGMTSDEALKRPEFTKLTPLYPQERFRLETEPNVLTTRVIDLVMPIGKGQRALIVSPPKAGKTMVLQAIANAIAVNNPECHLMVVLVDERPEEVTDMQRSVKGEVIASTFDRPPQDHITVAELSIERAKRLVELGHDVVVLLDSITRLGRAYNLGAPASGRILTGGVDSAALYPPKRFLGAARNIENGGSLTIIATALVETGSAMDTVIFEEFKGTGNAELKLDRKLADKRIFPAIDVDASGTRKEEILLAPDELRIVLQLRRVLHALDTGASLELLLDKMKSTRTNIEFLMQIQKTSATPD